MALEFSEEDMVDFLLRWGFVISFKIEAFEENVYQNVFTSSLRIVIEATKDGNMMSLETAFKKQLLNQI